MIGILNDSNVFGFISFCFTLIIKFNVLLLRGTPLAQRRKHSWLQAAECSYLFCYLLHLQVLVVRLCILNDSNVFGSYFSQVLPFFKIQCGVFIGLNRIRRFTCKMRFRIRKNQFTKATLERINFVSRGTTVYEEIMAWKTFSILWQLYQQATALSAPRASERRGGALLLISDPSRMWPFQCLYFSHVPQQAHCRHA